MATSYQDDFIKTALRIPRDLHARLMESSREKGRSFNSELIHIISTHFEDLSQQVDELKEALAVQQRDRVAVGFTDATDQAAAVKVLLLQEAMLLKSRIERLGGKRHVLESPKAELVKRIDGERLTGTTEEQKSYFSRIIEQTPLTALLTTEELGQLAERVVILQRAQDAAAKQVSTK